MKEEKLIKKIAIVACILLIIAFVAMSFRGILF
ncbi:Uncharacterised protein [Clostridium baratii]|uniref:Uncharacterized protein n=1 Tax=Clostridium baratii TaxID=1561 RepID=A0A174QK82_9CLOT|nr:Uncharacterised protein [Clostridium baratii]